jgi:hypothetical protein
LLPANLHVWSEHWKTVACIVKRIAGVAFEAEVHGIDDVRQTMQGVPATTGWWTIFENGIRMILRRVV